MDIVTLALAKKHTNAKRTVINLCDYGINAYEMMAQGKTGTFTIDDAKDFWDRISTDSQLVLVTDDGTNAVVYDHGAVIVTGQNGDVWQISTLIALRDDDVVVTFFLFIFPADALEMTGIKVEWYL